MTDKDLIDVLLKDYELQRSMIASYWTLQATITTFILTAAGATASLAKSEQNRSWLYWLIPPMMVTVSGLTLIILRENYYSNVYLACVEEQINALANNENLVTWFSKVSRSASVVRVVAAVSSSAIFLAVREMAVAQVQSNGLFTPGSSTCD